MDELLRDFLTESSENLAKLDTELVELERTPGDLSRLNSVFRTIHTIKGTCGFLGLERLEHVAHAAENVLDTLRAGRLKVSPELIGDVLQAIDCIKEILVILEATEAEPKGDDTKIVERLNRWLPEGGKAAPGAPEGPAAAATPSTGTEASGAQERAALPATAPSSAVARATDDTAAGGTSLTDSTLRVGVEVLDKLMNLVGELALGRNQLLQLASAQEETPFAKPVQQLDRITTDLLEAVMKTRMQPIGNAWAKLPRLVRDLSRSTGKQIELVMRGAETELDRQILQAIQDPLTHMVRNSVDHGICAPEVRLAKGKPVTGTITLSARHEGGHVVIEITDDGAGIDAAKVRRKAIERGLVKTEVAEAMPDAQVLRFIFEPGFSTAEKVTSVSGRGVGMDVVRSNIDSIGGTVELSSQFGAGTTIRVKIPLTLAIISALLVGTAGETFAIPQIGIVELVRVTEEQQHLVERIHGAAFYRLRDTLLPLVSLRSLLRLPEMDGCVTCSIVVCQVGEQRFGLVVEEVFDTQEIVVKPVGRLIKHLQAYAGCTITGDGRVIMILDTTGIAGMSRLTGSQTHEDGARANRAAASSAAAAQLVGTESVLLFDAGLTARQAVPLSLVARLEEFPASAIEEADGQFMVQYRGVLMPVIGATPSMDVRAVDPRPVIVFSDRTRTMGLAVDSIQDIVEDQITLQRRATRAGVLGVAVIGGCATEIIDTDHFMRVAHGAAVTPTSEEVA